MPWCTIGAHFVYQNGANMGKLRGRARRRRIGRVCLRTSPAVVDLLPGARPAGIFHTSTLAIAMQYTLSVTNSH
jgi:hypothetical protein